MYSLLKTFSGIELGHLTKLAAMKIFPKMQERPYNTPKTFQWQKFFPPGFRPYFDISINIHEYAEMCFILTHGINIFVIYCITGAKASCHNDSFGQQFVYLWILKPFFSHF